MEVIVIEKRRKIGEINGANIFVWEFHDLVKNTRLKKWCQDRGFSVPYIAHINEYVEIDVFFRCQMRDVG